MPIKHLAVMSMFEGTKTDIWKVKRAKEKLFLNEHSGH